LAQCVRTLPPLLPPVSVPCSVWFRIGAHGAILFLPLLSPPVRSRWTPITTFGFSVVSSPPSAGHTSLGFWVGVFSPVFRARGRRCFPSRPSAPSPPPSLHHRAVSEMSLAVCSPPAVLGGRGRGRRRLACTAGGHPCGSFTVSLFLPIRKSVWSSCALVGPRAPPRSLKPPRHPPQQAAENTPPIWIESARMKLLRLGCRFRAPTRHGSPPLNAPLQSCTRAGRQQQHSKGTQWV